MRKTPIIKFSLALLLFLLQLSIQAQDTTKVLFIGNSLTFANDLPTVFKNLSMAGGHVVETDQSVFGGYTLQAHSTNPQTLQKIQAGNWDFVVLQEQSQIPSMFDIVETQFYPYGVLLDSLIHVNNPTAKTVMFLSFAHQNGDADILASGGFDTYWQMQGRLRQSYLHLADSIQAMVAPVGCAWREVRMAEPSLVLYSDVVHPSLAGTYLAANVFYATLFQQTTLGNSFMAGLDPIVAQLLQTTASNTVLDSLTLWNIGQSSGITPSPAKPKPDCKLYYGVACRGMVFSWEQMVPGKYTITCFRMNGQKADEISFSMDTESGSSCLTFPGLKPGIYFVRISNKQYSKVIPFFFRS